MKRGRSYFTLDAHERWVINDDLLYRSLFKEPGLDQLRGQILPALPPLPDATAAALEIRNSSDGRMIPIIFARGYASLRLGEIPVKFRDGDEKPTRTLIPLILGSGGDPREIAHLEVHVWHCLNRRHRTPEDYQAMNPSGRPLQSKSRGLPGTLARMMRWLIEGEFEAAQTWTRWGSAPHALQTVYLPLGMLLSFHLIDQWLVKGRLPPLDRCQEAIAGQVDESLGQVARKFKDRPFDIAIWRTLYVEGFRVARDAWKTRGPCFLETARTMLAEREVPAELLREPMSLVGDSPIDPCLHAIPGLEPASGEGAATLTRSGSGKSS